MPKIHDIIGHTLQKEQLQKDLESGNVSHAYLFSGPAHLGKMTLAHQFAFNLISKDSSKEKQEELQSSFAKLTHPDLYVLDQLWMEDVCDDWDIIAKTSNVPQAHRAKKPAAKTNIISIDDIRSLQARLIETGTGTYRCCIIRSVDRMQDAAANAFLKILEEPPEGLIFILTTESQGALLPTIVSRSRVMPFRRLAPKDIRSLLTSVSEEDAKFIIHIARGAPGIALELAKNPDALREHRLIHNNAASFWDSRSLKERISILEPLYKKGGDPENFLLHIAIALREKSPHITAAQTHALAELVEGLQTNAHKQLLAERFALTVSG